MSQAAPSPDAPSLVGSVVAGKYRITRLIGSGGMGTVWEGVHVKLGGRVAIKFIKPQLAEQPEARTRFEIEARAAARLQTKHAVHVYDYGLNERNLPYIVMEFLEGQSLSDAIVERGTIPPAEVAAIVVQAARALSKAHSVGIVHRDLKPDNIFLAKPPKESVSPAKGKETPAKKDAWTKGKEAADPPFVVKLVDFGIAKILEDPSKDAWTKMGGPTREGTVIGTPNFMAPEQLTQGGAPGPATDLWALGASTFAAMTGRLPFEGDVLGDIVLKVCAAPLPVPSKIRPSLPPGFDAWFARACARDPKRRFQSADELAQALAGVCGAGRLRMATFDEDQIQYTLRPKGPAQDIPPPGMPARTAVLAGIVLGIAIMVGLLGFFAWRDHGVTPSAPPPHTLPTQAP